MYRFLLTVCDLVCLYSIMCMCYVPFFCLLLLSFKHWALMKTSKQNEPLSVDHLEVYPHNRFSPES